MLTHPTRPGIILTSAVTAGLLIASCGADSETLSKAEFIEQADAICESTNDRIEPVFDEAFADLEDEDFGDLDNDVLFYNKFNEAMDEAVPEEQLEGIRAFNAPSEDEELIDELIDDQGTALAEFAVLMDSAAGGDQAAIATLDLDEDPFEEINRRAREYGLEICDDADG